MDDEEVNDSEHNGGGSSGREIDNGSESRSALDTPSAMTSTEELLSICRSFVQQLRNGTAPWVVQRLDHTYGPMPSDPANFSFWIALVRIFLS